MSETEQMVTDIEMDEVKEMKMEIIKEVESMKTEADKNKQEMKTKMEEQAKEMEQLKKKGEMNERAVSTLFAKMNQSNDERREEMRQMRVNQEVKLAECNGRVSGATAAMSTLFRSMLEEDIKKAVTSMAEKHSEEISQLKRKMEEMSEEWKQGQKRLKHRVDIGLPNKKTRNEANINFEEVSRKQSERKSPFINVNESIVPAPYKALTKELNLRDSLLVLNPQSNPIKGGWQPSVIWTIYGLEKTAIIKLNSFEFESVTFNFPEYPIAARLLMRWKDDGRAHFSLQVELEEEEMDKGLFRHPPLRFVLKNQRVTEPHSHFGLLDHVKRQEYLVKCNKNVISKHWFTHPVVNVNDSVVIGMGVDPDAMLF